MNRLLLFLFSCFALVASAQTDFAEKQAFFDFNEPTNLHPAVTDLKTAGDIHNVIKDVYTDEHGLITVSFSKDLPDSDKIPNDALLTKEGIQYNGESYLWFFRADCMHIDAKDVEITGFYFVKTSPNGIKCNTGGMMCHGESLGWFDHDATTYSWTAKQTGIHHVDLLNTGQDATLNSLVVTYRTQMDVILPESVLPADKSKVNSFENFVLNFYEPIRMAENVTFKLTGEETEYALTSSFSEDGKTVTLTPALEVAPGTYTLVCPEKSFYSASDEFYNPEYTYTFTLVEPLKVVSTTPAEGKVGESLSKEITITFNKFIGYVSDADKAINLTEEDGGHVTYATAAKVTDTKKVVVTLSGFANGISETGVYYLDIPEGFIYDIDYETDQENATYNKALHLQFIVGDIVRPSVEKVEEAQAVLEVTGVGTPKADAAERLALAEMVAKNKCSDDQLDAAIAAFYSSTDIEMPKKGSYYTITNVAKNGTKRYLAYKEGAVTLTSDEAKAYSFLADSLETGQTTFRTFDKKYLHMLVNSNRYGATTTKNVTDAYTSEVNDLQLAVFDAEGIERKDRMGYMTIYGAVGKKSESDPMIFAYALVDTTTPEGTIELDTDGEIYFNENASSVFAFAEAEAPQPEAVKYVVSPAANTVLDEDGDIYVSFLGDEEIYADTENLQAVLKNGEKEYELSCTMSTENDKSKAQLHFVRVEDGDYTLVIPKGFFYHLGDEGQKYDVEEITVSYQVKSSDVFATDYIKVNETCIAIYNNLEDKLVVGTGDINRMSLYLYSNADPRNTYDVTVTDKIFSLYNVDTSKKVAEGKFTKRDAERYIPEISIYDGDEWIGYVDGQIDIESTTPYRYYLKGNYQHTREAKYTYVTYAKGGQYTAVKENDVVVSHLLDVKFNKTLKPEDVPNSYYALILEEGTIGDENFGLYLEGDTSVKKSDCHVNARQFFYFDIDSSVQTGVEPVQILPAAVPSVYDLSGRRVSDSSRSGLYIKNGKKVFVK